MTAKIFKIFEISQATKLNSFSQIILDAGQILGADVSARWQPGPDSCKPAVHLVAASLDVRHLGGGPRNDSRQVPACVIVEVLQHYYQNKLL